MKLLARGRAITGKRIAHRLGFFANRVSKKIRRFGARAPQDQAVAFIFGCQRSGTTLLSEIFSLDPSSDVYPERSALSRGDDPERLRLSPLAEARARIARNPAALVVAKPLVESQHCLDILAMDPRWRAIWIYRDYRDVALSNQVMFGRENGLSDLARLMADTPDWRNETLDGALRAEIGRLAAPARPNDSAALFWYARNSLFYSQRLDANGRVWLCDYASLVADPQAEIARIYAFLGRPPRPLDMSMVHATSVGRGGKLDLSEEVERKCDEMLAALDATRAAQDAAS